MIGTDEPEVYRAAIHGDQEAFEVIIRTQSRTLFTIAYGILQNREEAEDAVQDTLVKAWKSRRHVRHPEKLPAWLCMIARNRACEVLRKRRGVPLPDDVSESVVGETNSNTNTINDESLDQRLESALTALPELHRSALLLRYFDEMDYHSIQESLGLTHGALRGILGRALATMRKQLKPALVSVEQL